jgi:hypothetical protein
VRRPLVAVFALFLSGCASRAHRRTAPNPIRSLLLDCRRGQLPINQALRAVHLSKAITKEKLI